MTRLHGKLTAVLVLVAATPARAVNLRMEASTTWAENIGRSTAGLRVAKRLTSAWRFAAVADWQQDYARESIFDTRHHRVFGTVTWDIDDRWQLS